MVANLLTPTTLRWSTLSATSRKEGKKLLKPSFPLAEERVVERSNDRVSRYTSDISANADGQFRIIIPGFAAVISKVLLSNPFRK